MTTFLFLILLLFFVIIPLIRGLIAIYRVRSGARRFFDQFRQTASSASRRESHAESEPVKKKINPDDGEFVAFEELPPDDSPNMESRTEITIEQQVVDIEWEDIK